MNLVFDEGLALFAGLNVIPKRSCLAAYSSRLCRRANVRLMETWFQDIQTIGLPRSGSQDLDFHMVPANTAKEPLQTHYVPKRSHSQQGGVGISDSRCRRARAVLCQRRAAVRHRPGPRGADRHPHQRLALQPRHPDHTLCTPHAHRKRRQEPCNNARQGWHFGESTSVRFEHGPGCAFAGYSARIADAFNSAARLDMCCASSSRSRARPITRSSAPPDC